MIGFRAWIDVNHMDCSSIFVGDVEILSLRIDYGPEWRGAWDMDGIDRRCDRVNIDLLQVNDYLFCPSLTSIDRSLALMSVLIDSGYLIATNHTIPIVDQTRVS